MTEPTLTAEKSVDEAFNYAVRLLGDLFAYKQQIREASGQQVGLERYRVTFSGMAFGEINEAFHALGVAIRNRPAAPPSDSREALEHVLKVFTSMADRGRYPIELLPYVEGEPNPHYLGKQGWAFLTDAIAGLPETKDECQHHWVSGDNKHVSNAAVCLKCKKIVPANTVTLAVETSPPLPVPSADLLDYGYAPGNYIGGCVTCHKQMWNVDKRCRTCKECAESRREKAMTGWRASLSEEATR